ncbi:MAG: hypothetical protein KatS3mg103_0331 [Phycisphaerales bacterium]|nr:MAG: hypothetical protein KatS3mg103_0331 [Phycisphaerales bacterium]
MPGILRTASIRPGFGLARCVALLAVLAGALAAGTADDPVITLKGAPAKASSHAAGKSTFEFRLVAFATDPVDALYGDHDPIETTDLAGTPYRQQVIDIAGWKLGAFRRQGPHLIAMQNSDLGRHMRKLEQHVPQLVPADFTGLVVIDYEPWWALWERTPNHPSTQPPDALDGDYKDDWRDYIREHRPYLLEGLDPEEQEAVFKKTYEAFVKTFLLATYYKCKQLRPRAKWTFYNYPQVLVHSDLTPPGVQGYGDLTHQASRLNDRLEWFFEAVDFVAPRIYPNRKVLEQWPPSERLAGDISPAVHEQWLSSIVRESVRLARGKPVYPIHSAIYFSPIDRLSLRPVTRYQHEEGLPHPRRERGRGGHHLARGKHARRGRSLAQRDLAQPAQARRHQRRPRHQRPDGLGLLIGKNTPTGGPTSARLCQPHAVQLVLAQLRAIFLPSPCPLHPRLPHIFQILWPTATRCPRSVRSGAAPASRARRQGRRIIPTIRDPPPTPAPARSGANRGRTVQTAPLATPRLARVMVRAASCGRSVRAGSSRRRNGRPQKSGAPSLPTAPRWRMRERSTRIDRLSAAKVA